MMIRARQLYKRHPWRVMMGVVLLFAAGSLWWAFWRDEAVNDPRLVGTLTLSQRPDAIAVSKDGTLVAIGDQHGQVILWRPDTHTTPVRWSGHNGSVSALAFSTDDRLLLSGGSDGVIRAWDTLTQQQRYALPPLMFSKDSLPDEREEIATIVVSPMIPLAAAGTTYGTTMLFHSQSGKEQTTIRRTKPEGVYAIESLAVSADGLLVAVAYRFEELVIWGSTTRRELAPRSYIIDCRFVANDRQLLTIELRGDTQRWLVEEGRLLAEQSPQADDFARPRISPDGSLIARGGRTYDASFFRGFPIIGRFPDPEIQLVAFDDFAPVAVLAGHEGGIYRLAFNQTGTFLVSSGWSDNTVRLWDLTGIAAP